MYKTQLNNYYNDVVKNSYICEQKFWGNMFIKNFSNPTDYTQYHCNCLCQIINEMIDINNYYDFSFSFKNNNFVAYQNGYPKLVANIRDKDIAHQIFIIMNIYMMFLSKTKDNELTNVSENDGIVLLNLDFG